MPAKRWRALRILFTKIFLFATLFGIGLVLWKRPSLLVLFYQRGPHINTWFVEDFVKTHTIRPCQVRRSGMARIKGPNWLSAGPLEGLKIGKGEWLVIQGMLIDKVLLLFLPKSGGSNWPLGSDGPADWVLSLLLVFPRITNQYSNFEMWMGEKKSWLKCDEILFYFQTLKLFDPPASFGLDQPQKRLVKKFDF